MTNFALGSGYRFDAASGRVLNAKHQRLAEILHDYNPELRLAWIPPEDRNAEDVKPFAVIHDQSDGNSYVVMLLSEDELDHRVLGRIFAADMSRQNPDNVMAQIEAFDAAQNLMEAKEAEERNQERLELARSILKSPLHKFRHGGKVYE